MGESNLRQPRQVCLSRVAPLSTPEKKRPIVTKFGPIIMTLKEMSEPYS
jgi:hypothetical protein